METTEACCAAVHIDTILSATRSTEDKPLQPGGCPAGDFCRDLLKKADKG